MGWLTDSELRMKHDELDTLKMKRDDITKKIENFLAAHENADGRLSAADAEKLRNMENQAVKYSGLIEEIQDELLRQPSKEEREKYYAILPNPGADNPFVLGTLQTSRPGIYGQAYRRNFIHAFRQNFKGAHDYLREGASRDGGYLLPTEFDTRLVTRLAEDNVLRQISRVITTASVHQINIVASEPAASWIGEGEEIQLSKPEFAQKSLGAYKLAVGSKVSNELLQDSYYDLETALIDIFGRAISSAEEEAFINGDGTGNKPLGVFKALSASASSFVTSRGAEISADDIFAVYYSVERPYRRNAVWLASDSAVENLRRLRDANQNFLWSNSLVDGEPPTLLGAKIFTSRAMPAVSTGEVPLLFGDFRNFFVIGDRGQRQIRPLRELYALSDMTAYLMIQRVDCCVTDTRAFRGLKIK